MAVLNNRASACLLWLGIIIVWKVAQTYQASREPPLDLSITYTRDQLLQLRPLAPVVPDIEFLEIKPRAGARVRKRGRRGGIQARNRQCGYKPVLPSVIMGNVRSLINKTDELTACLKSDRLYRLSSLLCFSETWTKYRSLTWTWMDFRFLGWIEIHLRQARSKAEAFVYTSTSAGVTLGTSRSRRECVTRTSSFLQWVAVLIICHGRFPIWLSWLCIFLHRAMENWLQRQYRESRTTCSAPPQTH